MIRHNFLKNMDSFFAYAGLLVSFIMLVLLYLIKSTYIDMGVTLLASCIVYFVIKNKLSNQEIIDSFEIKFMNLDIKSIYLIFNSIFLFVYGASLFSLHFGLYYRPLSYFVLTIIACVLVSIEIFAHRNNWLILSKIILIAISLRASLYYVFPGLVASDPYYWVRLINFTMTNGHLLESVVYYNYPVYNLVVTTTSLMANVDIKNAMFMSIGLFEIFGIVYVYLIGKIISRPRIGLIGALLVGISQFHIKMGVLIFQMSIGLGMYTFIIYLFFKSKQPNKIIFTVILIFSIMVMTVTHHLSNLILLITLIFMFLGQKYPILLYGKKAASKFNNASPFLFIISFISMIAYWMFNGSWQFRHLVESVVNVLQDITSEQINVITVPIEYNLYLTELKQAGILIFIFFAIIGNIYWTSFKFKNSHRLILTFGGSLLMISTFFFIFSGMTNVIINRWFPFIYVLIAIPAGQGVVLIMSSFKSDRNKVLSLILIISVFSIIMTTTHSEELEPSFYTESKILWRYMESDIVSADRILGFTDDATIQTDDRYSFYFDSLSGVNSIYTSNLELNEVTIIREAYLNQYYSLTIEKDGVNEKNYLKKYDGSELVKSNDKISSRFYDSNKVRAYRILDNL